MESHVKIVAIIQARMGSTRLPGKVLKKLTDKSIINIIVSRLGKSRWINEIYVATSDNAENDILCKEVECLDISLLRGSETDVLERFYLTACAACADVVVRITGDCPIVDPNVVDQVIKLFFETNADYASNIEPPTFPDGLDVEVFSMCALEKAQCEAQSSYDREHVTPFIRNGDFRKANLTNIHDVSSLRLTLDEPEDLKLLTAVFKFFEPDIYFKFDQVVEFLKQNPVQLQTNSNLIRNEGADMGTGQKLWKRAKKVIPGGNMLLSKRSEMHLPDKWPSYFSRTKGCLVWDLDGNQLVDTYYMGVGTNILGYSHPEIDSAVKDVVNAGNMSTLNAPEEVWLAEKLLEINPWAGGVRFARSGGEANAIAIRISRALAGKEGVAVCGYHGWHDWYLSANLGTDDKLSGHLLPGLSTAGVPESLRGSVHPFEYNDFDELSKIVSNQSIGVIKMEVMRSVEPQNNFLQKVRQICDDNGIVLVFDECTSGFRETFGGLHAKYGVMPDVAVYGKTLGNGYAISAVVGRADVMRMAETTFISSTFWTERIGSAAGLKTLEVMAKVQPWNMVTKTGKKVRNLWQNMADKHDLKISIGGLPSISTFAFRSQNALQYKTLLTQEMLKKGFLAGTAFYVCTEHTNEILDEYENNIDPIFKLIKECEEGRDLRPLIDGKVCHDGFRRLN
jgi:glutamate-1-semialdehyde 2,1-aminomutase